jgi:hypothetical protein
MSTEQEPVQQDEPVAIPAEKTNAYRAGFMAGYTADNDAADPSVAGYMDGYFVQREGEKPADSE